MKIYWTVKSVTILKFIFAVDGADMGAGTGAQKHIAKDAAARAALQALQALDAAT